MNENIIYEVVRIDDYYGRIEDDTIGLFSTEQKANDVMKAEELMDIVYDRGRSNYEVREVVLDNVYDIIIRDMKESIREHLEKIGDLGN